MQKKSKPTSMLCSSGELKNDFKRWPITKERFWLHSEEITRQAGPLNFSAARLLSHEDDVCRHMIKEKRKRDEIRLGYAEGMQDICATVSLCLPNLHINIHQHLHSSFNSPQLANQIGCIIKITACLVTHACGLFVHFNYRKNLRILRHE